MVKLFWMSLFAELGRHKANIDPREIVNRKCKKEDYAVHIG